MGRDKTSLSDGCERQFWLLLTANEGLSSDVFFESAIFPEIRSSLAPRFVARNHLNLGGKEIGALRRIALVLRR